MDNIKCILCGKFFMVHDPPDEEEDFYLCHGCAEGSEYGELLETEPCDAAEGVRLMAQVVLQLEARIMELEALLIDND